MKKTITLLKITVLSLFAIALILLNATSVVLAAETESNETVSANLSSALIGVEKYSIGTGILEAGKDVTIMLTLRNLSSNVGANNVMITTSSTSGMIYPVYGSDNQIYVGNISAGSTKEISIPVSVSPKFNGDYVDFTCEFAYQSGLNKLSNTSTMIIPTSGGSTIKVKAISLSSHASVNAKTLLSISYSNNSGSNITDAKLVVDGNVSFDSKSIPLGTVKPGKNYAEDLYIIFSEEGSQNVNIKLTYTDISGEPVEIDLGKYTVSVSEELAPTVSGKGYDKNLSLIGKLIALVAMLAACVCTFFYIKKR